MLNSITIKTKTLIAFILIAALTLASGLISLWQTTDARNGIEKGLQGPNRPYSYPVSVPVRKAVEKFLTDYPEVQLVAVARNGVEPEDGITMVLATLHPIPLNFRKDLRNTVRQARGLSVLEDFTNEKTVVRIFVLRETPILIESEKLSDAGDKRGGAA